MGWLWGAYYYCSCLETKAALRRFCLLPGLRGHIRVGRIQLRSTQLIFIAGVLFLSLGHKETRSVLFPNATLALRHLARVLISLILPGSIV